MVLYQEVEAMALEKGFSIELSPLLNDSPVFNYAHGSHEVDELSRKIIIKIRKDSWGDVGVWVHEILHAKLYLTGYPRFYIFPSYQQPPALERFLSEIENTAQHTLIYKEMKQLGYEHSQIDEEIVNETIIQIDTVYEGPDKIRRAWGIFEAYLKNPDIILSHDLDFRKKQPYEYSLFKKFKNKMFDTSSPAKMREAIVSCLDLIEKPLTQMNKQEYHLKIFNSIPAVLSKSDLSRKAKDIFYILQFNEFPHYFVMGRRDKQCCFFLNPLISREELDYRLDAFSAEEFLMFCEMGG